jgi:hypothetical protein
LTIPSAAFPLQSWIFANLIDVFRLTGKELTDGANFWALIFFILSLGIAVCYAAVGYSANRLSVVSKWCLDQDLPF